MEKKVVYCDVCEQEIVLSRKSFNHKYHEILFFMIVLTLGLGYFVYLILKYRKKKDTCPNCESKFDLTTLKRI